MSDVEIKIDGLEDLLSRLSEAAEKKFWVRARFAGAELLRDVIAQYPPLPHYPLRWASRKQFIWYMSAIRRGQIQAPYVRQHGSSQRLGSSWTSAIEGNDVFCGTEVTYAKYVQSEEHQQPFHKDTGWRTDKFAAEQVAKGGDLERAVKDLLDDLFRR